MVFIVLFELAVIVFFIAAYWKVYAKAGQPGWGVLIPIYNIYLLTKIVGRPWWWLLLMLIPIVGFIIAIIMTVDLAKVFAKGVGFALLLIFLPFIGYPVLGFGSAEYIGPASTE